MTYRFFIGVFMDDGLVLKRLLNAVTPSMVESIIDLWGANGDERDEAEIKELVSAIEQSKSALEKKS